MKSDGFSLLELLVVLAIVGILASIGSASYIRWINLTRADAAAAEVGRLMDKASSRVRTTNKDVTFTIDATANTIKLSQGGVMFAGGQPLDATISSLTCRPACLATPTVVTVKAPFGGFVNNAVSPVAADIKIVITRNGLTRSVYALGPAALLKVVRN
ncbi:type II secretion system protein [Deinococcus deserti]|uniref:Putative prepilin-like protein n=1 Tax=Deinococcus deserti (strain DSM 17065 / CIP 109153 / LMG 22923 / VCD115) TaxID=546414 RepID=C1CZ47_DEIDV|nr:type II secretion system protein [Deinococcus deserti]ACO45085.1 putative prepilin-like protein, precursor [Deinococcus deserti VCD115]